MNARGDTGSAGMATLLGVGVACFGTVAAGALVAASVSHTRVESVADLTALAAAGGLLTEPDPCAVAAETATGNGARLVECQVTGAAATVTVAVSPPPLVARALGSEIRGSARAQLVVERPYG